MADEDREIQAVRASLERKRNRVKTFKRWFKRARIVLALAAALLAVYIIVSYRIYTVPGAYDAEDKRIQSPVNEVERGDMLLLQNLNLWREPKLGDLVIYTHDEPGDGAPGTLIGRVTGLPGETVRHSGPALQVEDRNPLPISWYKAPAEYGDDGGVEDGDVVPDGHYLITTDTDAVAYADSRDFGYVPAENINKRVIMNLSLVFGRRPADDEDDS